MTWTAERMELLRMLWNEGLAASAIAEKLGEGCSRNAVIGKAHRLELEPRPSPVKGADDGAAVATDAVTDGVAAGGSAPVPLPAPPRKPAAPRIKAVKPVRTTLLDLSDRVCKWPIGHPGEKDFHFCGKPSNAGFPYCGEHCAVAYQAQMPRRDRPGRPLPPVRVR